jgi:hypothetical protein
MHLVQTSPLVSVVIPAYNRPAYLRDAIAGVLDGEYQEFEVIVSDDCSPSELATTVAQFRDPRLRYRRNSSNLGVAANVRTAIAAARGKYFTLLNDDDFWTPAFLSRLVPALEAHPDAVLAFCDHRVVDSAGTLLSDVTDRNSRLWGRDKLDNGLHHSVCELAVTRRSIAPAVAAVFRRGAADWTQIPDDVGPAYDVWMGYLACRTRMPAYYIPDQLTNYRTHVSMQTSVGHLQHALGAACALQFMLDDPLMAPLRADLEQMWSRTELSAGIAFLDNGQRLNGRKHIRRALRVNRTLRCFVALELTYVPHTLSRPLIWAGRHSRGLLARVARRSRTKQSSEGNRRASRTQLP